MEKAEVSGVLEEEVGKHDGAARRFWKAHGFIRRISSDHPEYGEDRIALELELKFGIRHSTATIRKYMVSGRPGSRDSQAWRTFLNNQSRAIWSCDFFVQHTVGFRVLYVFVIMELASRKVVHVTVTEHPTIEWVKQQVRNACFEDQLPKFLIHDNDGKYGQSGRPLSAEKMGRRISCRCTLDVWLLNVMVIRGIPTPYRAPNAGPRGATDRNVASGMPRSHADLERASPSFNPWRVHRLVQPGPSSPGSARNTGSGSFAGLSCPSRGKARSNPRLEWPAPRLPPCSLASRPCFGSRRQLLVGSAFWGRGSGSLVTMSLA